MELLLDLSTTRYPLGRERLHRIAGSSWGNSRGGVREEVARWWRGRGRARRGVARARARVGRVEEQVRLAREGRDDRCGPDLRRLDEGAAEIPGFDPASKRAFVVNGFDHVVDVFDLSDPSSPTKVGVLDVSSFAPRTAWTLDGVVAVASTAIVVEDGENEDDPTKPGTVAFFDANGNSLRAPIVLGGTPDMVTFTDDGKWLLIANEGEPSSHGEAESLDPEGSLSVVDMRSGIAAATARTAGFHVFDAKKAALEQAASGSSAREPASRRTSSPSTSPCR